MVGRAGRGGRPPLPEGPTTMSRPGPATASAVTPRGPGDPEPDLLDYLVVHRAMTVDSDRLAVAAAELVRGPDPARMTALRRYLGRFAHEIESHHHVEDAFVWPVLEAGAGGRAALGRLTDDHERAPPPPPPGGGAGGGGPAPGPGAGPRG